MTISGRRGHWRTNGAGKTFWVKEHSVERINYTLSKKGAKSFVNGERLLETRCKYCYEKVFYFTNKSHQNVLFNKNLEPLTLHNCRKDTRIQKVETQLNLPKKFLDENDVKALDRRAEELNERINTTGQRSPTKIPGYYDRNFKEIYNYLVKNQHSFQNLKAALYTTPFLEMYPAIITTSVKKILKFKETYSDVPLSAREYKKKTRAGKFLFHNLTQLTASNAKINGYVKNHSVKLLELKSQLGKAISDLDSLHNNRVSRFAESQKEKAKERRLERSQSRVQKKQKKQPLTFCICAACGKTKPQDRFKNCESCRKGQKFNVGLRKVPVEIRRKKFKIKN